jgi:predicted metal-binding protein
MKITELNTIIENIVSDEIRKTIIAESEGNKKEVFHVTCEGEPIETFDTQEDAETYINDNKDKHPDQELLIDKATYESHSDMLDKLDEMGQQLEEKENTNMKNQQPMEGNQFSAALLKAKENGEDNFTVDGKEYNVEECWQQMEEEEIREDEHCEECGDDYMKKSVTENAQKCEECGTMLNEEGICGECSGKMYESKKKTLRLSETELVTLITKMVSESLPPITKTAQDISAKQNKEAMADVDKKMKDYLSFDGNDNPEFPKAIGKGEKVTRENTPDQEDEIAKNFAGLENLDYDIEPSEQFKKRLKMAIEGDKLMGNAPTTEKTDVKPSNGAKLGEEPKDKDGNSIPTPETAKKIEKQVKDRAEDKKNRVRYEKEPTPIKNVHESKVSFSNILNEEIKKMKDMVNYNKKTQ